MRSFLERLLFPVTTYTPGYRSIAPRKIATALVYTMNIAAENVPVFHYDTLFGRMQATLARIFGSCELLLATDTLQFDDYGKYLSTVWDAAAKGQTAGRGLSPGLRQGPRTGRAPGDGLTGWCGGGRDASGGRGHDAPGPPRRTFCVEARLGTRIGPREPAKQNGMLPGETWSERRRDASAPAGWNRRVRKKWGDGA